MLKLNRMELKGYNMAKKVSNKKQDITKTNSSDVFLEYIETFKNAIHSPRPVINKFLTKYQISDIKEEATGKKLRAAVENNNIKKALYYLENGVSPEGFGFNGNLLGIAIKNKSAEMIELLFAYGATITGKDEGKEAPIVRAVQSNSASLVSLLLEKGADANFVYRTDAENNDWSRPIHQPILCDAVDNNNTEICRLLLKYKANPNVCGLACCDHPISCPLSKAVAKQNMDLVYMFVENGANTNGYSPKGDSNQMPLTYAIWNNDIACAEYLLDNGADINKRPFVDGTPLSNAISRDLVTMVKMLIARGANLDVVDSSWDEYRGSQPISALDYAISNNADPEIIRVCRYPDEARKFYMKRIDPNKKKSNIIQFKKALCDTLKKDIETMSRLTFYNKMFQFAEKYTGVKKNDAKITPLQAEIYDFVQTYIKEMTACEDKTPISAYEAFEKEVKQNAKLLNINLQLVSNLQNQKTR